MRSMNNERRWVLILSDFMKLEIRKRFVELNVPRIIIDLRENRKLIIINKVNYHLDGNSEIGRNV